MSFEESGKTCIFIELLREKPGIIKEISEKLAQFVLGLGVIE